MNNPEQRRGFLTFDQIAIETQLAAEKAREADKKTDGTDSTEVLVDRMLIAMFGELTPQERTTIGLANQVMEEYNNLPKQTGRERRSVRKLIAQTAGKLLGNPQDIFVAYETWRGNESSRDGLQELEEPFSKLVIEECLALIKDKWQDITPEQLAQLVRISSDENDPSQDFAKKMLKNHFKGPDSKSRRIKAYYNFASTLLELVGDNALNEGIKIAFHATDILPRDPYLIEKSILLSLPDDGEEEDFKESLIANHIVNQISFLGSQGTREYHRENGKFLMTNEKLKRGWNKKKELLTRKIGHKKGDELNAALMTFFNISQSPLPEELRQSLRDKWPYSVAFDENDPLNQKFQKVLSKRGALPI